MLQRGIAWFRIPRGSYCYTGARGRTEKRCPYYRAYYWTEEDDCGEHEYHISYCRLEDVFEEVLLWDQCKICGIKENWDV